MRKRTSLRARSVSTRALSGRGESPRFAEGSVWGINCGWESNLHTDVPEVCNMRFGIRGMQPAHGSSCYAFKVKLIEAPCGAPKRAVAFGRQTEIVSKHDGHVYVWRYARPHTLKTGAC